MQTEAVLVRNKYNKQLFDIVVIEYTAPIAEVILEGLQFNLASAYVEDYNMAQPKVEECNYAVL